MAYCDCSHPNELHILKRRDVIFKVCKGFAGNDRKKTQNSDKLNIEFVIANP